MPLLVLMGSAPCPAVFALGSQTFLGWRYPSMRSLAFLLLLLILLSSVGCRSSSTTSGPADGGAAEASTALRLGSCDRSPTTGTCSDYDAAYLAQNQNLLTTSCTKLGGTFVFGACPNTSVVGACKLST